MALVTRKTLIPLAVLALAVPALSACAPQDMESTPVKVETPKGDVLCQLYARDLIYWDRAVQVPTGMSAADADAICRARGEAWKTTGK